MTKGTQFIVLIACLSGLSFFGCDSKKEADQEKEAEAAPLSALESALVPGVWSGDYGEIRLEEGGGIDLSIQNCGYETLSPGVIKMEPGSSCSVDSYKGSIDFEEYEIGVTVEDDGVSYRFGAYMDGDVLHAGIGEVAAIEPDRTGLVKISPVRFLSIGETCTLELRASGEEKKVHCRFLEVDGQTIFRFEEPDRFDETKMKEGGLVYLEHLNLLVSPSIAQMTFTKK